MGGKVLDLNALAVERQTCDYCGEPPGSPCITGSGGPRAVPHSPRLEVAMIPQDVIAWRCEKCWAAQGESCRSDQHRAVAYHAIRKRAALFGRQLDVKAGA
jgi:hypothetical protein